MVTTREPTIPFPVGDSPADFKIENAGIEFTDQDFGGRRRPNESFLSAIEKAAECLFWRENLIDSVGTCDTLVLGGSFRSDRDKVVWKGKIGAVKDGTVYGRGEFFTTFTSTPLSKKAMLDSVYIKMYKDQRDRMREHCVV